MKKARTKSSCWDNKRHKLDFKCYLVFLCHFKSWKRKILSADDALINLVPFLFLLQLFFFSYPMQFKVRERQQISLWILNQQCLTFDTGWVLKKSFIVEVTRGIKTSCEKKNVSRFRLQEMQYFKSSENLYISVVKFVNNSEILLLFMNRVSNVDKTSTR